MKKTNITVTIRYKIPPLLPLWPFFVQRGGRGSRKCRLEAEIFGIFSIEVAPKEGKGQKQNIFKSNNLILLENTNQIYIVVIDCDFYGPYYKVMFFLKKKKKIPPQVSHLIRAESPTLNGPSLS